ncbi:MAG: fumarylacetoacetate hydrolase family protein [Pseudomonadota bacterium]
MKIAQFTSEGRIRLGIIEISGFITPLDFEGDMLDFLQTNCRCRTTGGPIPVEDVSFAPPLSNPSKIIGIGRNYFEHISEGNRDIPKTPMIFSKFTTCLTGHRYPIRWSPDLTEKVDFEAELAVIIGREACQVREKDAMDVVFGYTCANDVSARDLQYADGQWVRGKSLDTFCPLGPWIVTRDDIPDPHSLDITCRLNGEIMQSSNTEKMIFKIPYLISYLSRSFTLKTGDVILTGTPHGVGAYQDPPLFMKNGDEVIVEIGSIGRLENFCQTV